MTADRVYEESISSYSRKCRMSYNKESHTHARRVKIYLSVIAIASEYREITLHTERRLGSNISHKK